MLALSVTHTYYRSIVKAPSKRLHAWLALVQAFCPNSASHGKAVWIVGVAGRDGKCIAHTSTISIVCICTCKCWHRRSSFMHILAHRANRFDENSVWGEHCTCAGRLKAKVIFDERLWRHHWSSRFHVCLPLSIIHQEYCFHHLLSLPKWRCDRTHGALIQYRKTKSHIAECMSSLFYSPIHFKGNIPIK